MKNADIFSKICLLLIVVALIFCSLSGIPILLPLMAGLGLLCLAAVWRGFQLKQIGHMLLADMALPMKTVPIFLMIGVITAMWRASGTIPMIIYYGAEHMNPRFFILASFWICSVVSFLLGTAFGTVGTIGLTLMVMARGGGVDSLMIAGAIISGSFLGDQCSPMSSTTNLIALMTDSALHKNVANMLKALILPLVLTSVFFAVLSWGQPLQITGNALNGEIGQYFTLNLWVLLPAFLVLVLMVFKVSAQNAMMASALVAAWVAWYFQAQEPWALLRQALLGYEFGAPGALQQILPGGGVCSMLNSQLILMVSAMYSGIFGGTGMLLDLEQGIAKLGSRAGRAVAMTLAALATCCFAASQVFAVMVTEQLTGKMYDKSQASEREALAFGLESTAMLFSSLVPWNICSAVPAAMLGVGIGYIPYNMYALLIPLCYGILGYIGWHKKGKPKIEVAI